MRWKKTQVSQASDTTKTFRQEVLGATKTQLSLRKRLSERNTQKSLATTNWGHLGWTVPIIKEKEQGKRYYWRPDQQGQDHNNLNGRTAGLIGGR